MIANQKLPRVLYKYVSSERAISVLRSKTIRFTQPALLNDPFEFCPSLDLAQLKTAYLQLEDVKVQIEGGEDRKKVMKGFREFCLGVTHRFVSDAKAVGVLSLARHCDVPLMWSHYCNQHKGIVIGFDVTKGLLLAKPNRENPDAFCDVGPIDYQLERYRFPGRTTGRFDFMFVKDSCWEYEQEWRIIRSLKMLRLATDDIEDIYVVDFPAEAVVRIIEGLFTPAADLKELSSILSSEEYKNVETYATRIDSSKFELDITTSIGRALDNQDNEWEGFDSPNIREFYQFTSKGELFKAMEIIDESTTFVKEKDEYDL